MLRAGRSERSSAMDYDRKQVVTILRQLGFSQAADDAAAELPDLIPVQQLRDFADRHGITQDEMVSRMGGSP
jgi:hypothetical protein